MCQINTDPMKSQVGYLDVVVPPDILDDGTSADIIAREGNPVTLKCATIGSPTPQVIWRRENGESIKLREGMEVITVNSPTLELSKVTRKDMGAYLCIASNGIPPSVSKRIMLHVHFPPTIWIQNQLVGAVEKQSLILDCHCEAYPKSINYWTRERGEVIPDGNDYKSQTIDGLYKIHSRLFIKSVKSSDFGIFKCISKNSLGDTDGNIKIVRIAPTQMNYTKLEMTGKTNGFVTNENYYNEEFSLSSSVNIRGISLTWMLIIFYGTNF